MIRGTEDVRRGDERSEQCETDNWHVYIESSMYMIVDMSREKFYRLKCRDVCEMDENDAKRGKTIRVGSHMERRWIAIFTCIKNAMLTMNYVVFTFILMHLTNTGKGICIFDTICDV